MKHVFQKISALLLALLLVASLGVTAFAQDSTITYSGRDSIAFAPGGAYTATDLFPNFKNVMPGDNAKSQNVTIRNTSGSYIRLYMRAEVHDAEQNPPEVQADVATMQEFLSKLTLRIYKGSETVPFYSGTPDKTGILSGDGIHLANLESGQSMKLRAELDVPDSLDNRYAQRVGEVDWIFRVEDLGVPKELTVKKVWRDGGDNSRPLTIQVQLRNGEEVVDTVTLSKENKWTYTWEHLDSEGDWNVIEPKVPGGYTVSYKTVGTVTTITNRKGSSLIQTGQLNWPIPVLTVAGLALVAWGVMATRKKRRDDHG